MGWYSLIFILNGVISFMKLARIPMALFFGVFVSFCAASDSSLMKLLGNGVEAPRINLFDGNTKTSLAAYEGKFILVNFWATWCAPCVKEMPSLDRLAYQLSDQGLVVVAISQDKGGIFEVKPFLQKLKLNNTKILYDTKGITFRNYGLRGLPTTVLVSPQGMVVARLEGGAVWDKGSLADQIKDLITAGLINKRQ